MKTKHLFLITAFLVLLTSCDPVTTFSMVNNYHNPVYVISPELNCISLYPDTILPKDIEISSVLVIQDKLKTFDKVLLFQEITPPTEEIFCNNDTLSLYIFNADTVDSYSWDTVLKYNMVLQRYDLSMQDYKELNKARVLGEVVTLFFPPSEDMKHIHMWPPYGTYDENGQGRKK